MAGPLKNARHERFAQERAKGKSVDAAYAAAGYMPKRQNAARLMTNDAVAARVKEFQKRAATRTEITVATISTRLMRIADKGERLKEPAGLSVARASLMDAAKLNGLVVDRSKVGFDFSTMTDDELEFMERILARNPNA